jgi:short-subunit dehydrogenase
MAPTDHLKAATLFDASHVTAVVTGGGTGIGLMITRALEANGATVYITGRRREVLEEAAKTYTTGAGRIFAAPADISSKEDVIRLAKELEEKEPNGITLLVNNAGIARDDDIKFGQSLLPCRCLFFFFFARHGPGKSKD